MITTLGDFGPKRVWYFITNRRRPVAHMAHKGKYTAMMTFIEVLLRWTFYAAIVGLVLIILTALQVRQQIKFFDDFRDYAEYSNQIERLQALRQAAGEDRFRADRASVNWEYYRIEQENKLSEAENVLRSSKTLPDLSREQLITSSTFVLEVKPEDSPEIKAAINRYNSALYLLRITAQQMEVVKYQIARIDAETKLFEDRIKELNENAMFFLYGSDKNTNTGSGRAAIPPDRRVFTSLASYLGYPLIGRLVASPTDFLVMVLAMLMGAVGGILSVARAIVDPSVPPPTRSGYFLRPVFGLIVALVVFVLFKAGQLALSATSGDVSSLNPFVVGFIGVISGAMAKPAIDRIERAGGAVFGTDVEGADVYVRVVPFMALDEDGKKLLLQLLNVPTEVFESWNTGRERVPYAKARLIAAFFRQPMRDMFSNESAPV